VIDPPTLDVHLAGPAVPDDIPRWARWRKIRDVVQSELDFIIKYDAQVKVDLTAYVASSESRFDDETEAYEFLIATAETVLGSIDIALGSWPAMMQLDGTDLSHLGPLKIIRRKPRAAVLLQFFQIFVKMHEHYRVIAPNPARESERRAWTRIREDKRVRRTGMASTAPSRRERRSAKGAR
jgi:hypothetical protein